MSRDTEHASYEWADKAFEGAADVEPKYRDLLAMLAAAMMGNHGGAQHFYNRAIVDGASDAELHRMAEIARAQNIELGDLAANAQQAAEEIRAEREPSDDAEENQKTERSVN